MMTAERNSTFSRRDAPELFANVRPEKQRAQVPPQEGRREDRVHAAPAISCAKAEEENAHEHTGSAEAVRPSLRNGFTAYNVLSPVTGLLSPSPA
jgi:hypothetical protein